jgi:hypothetical protein|tara:strand:+ start:31 stop:192 length:162 start_codon:yes stop_codon:yes gene_type:complete
MKPKYTIDEIQTAVDIVIGDDGFSGKQVIKTVKLIHRSAKLQAPILKRAKSNA